MKIKILTILIIAAFVAACSGNKGPKKPGADGQMTHGGDVGNETIYFNYDKSDVKEAGRAVVERHSKHLASHAGTRVRLEGHADERGSREYNVALGQRRSQSVRRMMLFLGVNDGQIDLISYGEEKPAVVGSDETAWSQNRRVEINYKR